METLLTSQVFGRLSEAAQTLANQEVRLWKEQGGRVIGYFCSSVPEEVFTAAGFLPFRMRATGSSGTEMSDAFFSSINCSFPRHCFNQALKGEFGFLDGLVLYNSCDNVRRVYDHWIRQMDTPFVHFMSIPRRAEELQVQWYRDELRRLVDETENHFGVSIGDEELEEAITVHNEARRLQRALCDLRKKDKPPITGAEVLAVTVAGTAMRKDTFNRVLAELLQELAASEGKGGYRARLMILGGILDDPGYVGVIEDQGGLVVTDSTCFGTRIFWEDVDETSDPLSALARYYVADRPSCPRVFGLYEKRSDLWRQLVREFRVDGVVLERLTFCDNWGFEQFTIQDDFREWGIPLLMLDREYVSGGIGQLRTRVQAFLETIGR